MLKNLILSTIKFFDLQDWPVTLLELEKYLIDDVSSIMSQLNKDGNTEINITGTADKSARYTADAILTCLETECREQVENFLGFYFLKGRQVIAQERLSNYFYAIKREQLIKRYLWFLKHIPFVRGVAVGGSQALGRQKETSDIDLLIITDQKFLWIPRTLVVIYFQLLGKRRHGKNIANRFCLNHYISGEENVQEFKDLYNAMEYIRLRPLVYEQGIQKFQKKNWDWIAQFFPNAYFSVAEKNPISTAQKFGEKVFLNSFGRFIEKVLGSWQLARIKTGEFVLASNTELAFHSLERKNALLERFFKSQSNIS